MSKTPNVEVIVDFDKGIDKYNENNPHEEKMLSRKDVYEHVKVTKTTIQNFKNGKVPTSIKSMFVFLHKTGLKLEDIMSVTIDDEKFF